MIKRVFIQDLLSFDKIDITLDKGLNVITGPSGAGKSIFINSLLANFGLANQEAKLCEVELDKPKSLESDQYIFEEDELIIKAIKKDRVRFFLNNQNISKKLLKELFSPYLFYISVRDKKGFENETLLEIIDNYASKEKSFSALKNQYQQEFTLFKQKEKEYQQLKEKIKASKERIEFLEFEINKIKSINPKPNEYEELLEVKKQLSKLDKMSELAQNIENIFAFEDDVAELFELLDKDSSYFSEAMNQLRSDLEDIEELKESLSEINIEELLNRLEALSSLIKRFGSIEEALEYLSQKEQELKTFETIDEDLSELESFLKSQEQKLQSLANTISQKRHQAAKEIEKELEKILESLKLPKATFIFKKVPFYSLGDEEVDIRLFESKVEHLSGGEFNRLRLALLSVSASFAKEKGIIILDEIDANVSGDESIAIANLLAKLSKAYQIIAISHQPHLSAKAHKHILISKEENQSTLKALNKNERVQEIARIIGGKKASIESIEFAKKLLGVKK